MATDPQVDAYIERQAEFARPILSYIRETVHAGCPEAEETLKWGMPAFMYKRAILATMAAFKAHASFGFWRGEAVAGARQEGAMGQFGRITRIDDLPPRAELETMVRKAAALAESGEKPKRKASAKPAIEMPEDFRTALDAAPAAAATFDGFPPGARRDYLEWVTEAKRSETRAKRIVQSVEWLSEGKRRHWKYERC